MQNFTKLITFQTELPKICVRQCVFRNVLLRQLSQLCHDKHASITMSKLMGPDNANIQGNVHGGHIMNLLEEAGVVLATRYCNLSNLERNMSQVQTPSVASLARIERLAFKQPMYVGEMAEVQASVTFTSARSLLVIARVLAHNILTGDERVTNEAQLWYVPVADDKVTSVPPLEGGSVENKEHGLACYRKKTRTRSCSVPYPMTTDPEEYTVGHSLTLLTHLVNPGDVAHHGYCKGGVVLKLMDECAALAAGRHCMAPVVTASMDACNFLQMCPPGCLLTVRGYVTYTSRKSLEVQVLVDAELLFGGRAKRFRAAESHLVFVSVDQNPPRILDVPPVKVKTPLERLRYSQGHERYMQRSEARKLRRNSTS